MKRRRNSKAAEIEAYEEAGVVGRTSKRAIGQYDYLKDGELPCRVTVYPLPVERLRDDWPEKSQRKREWHRPSKAAELVDEEELKALLRSAPTLLDLS